jgi:hypothetical protein
MTLIVKRRVFAILLFLLLGAIVNVAVAWGVMFRPWPPPTSPARSVVRHVSDTDHTTILLRPGELLLVQAHIPRLPLASGPRPVVSEQEYARIVPRWSQFSMNEPIHRWLPNLEATDLGIAFAEHSSGWPALSLQYTFVERVAPRNARYVLHSNGLSLPVAWQEIDPGRRALPISSIWPGFAINTAFYAAILWLLFAAPFAIRKWRRIKRGLCPKCGYDLRGGVGATDSAVCPECGHPVETA